MVSIELHPEPITSGAFAPFGDVVMLEGAEQRVINEGATIRYHDLAKIDVSDEGGRAITSIFRGSPRELPFRLRLMERHPLGSQLFWPLADEPYLVVVASPGEPPAISDLRAFHVPAGIGVNYAKGVWHHPLLAINHECDFFIVDREGPGSNLDEIPFPDGTDVMLHGLSV